MSKRIRLLSQKNNLKTGSLDDYKEDNDVTTARGRLKGALMEALSDEPETSVGHRSVKKQRRISRESSKEYTPDKENKRRQKRFPARQAYVLKLFDRSVDLSQFKEDSPLYPICRAWIKNKPKENYNQTWDQNDKPMELKDSIELPGPEGPPVSRIPDLTSDQKASSKDKINLNYREAPPPNREQLIKENMTRWLRVRHAWFKQASKVEARYANTQQLLNKINVCPQ